MSLEDLGNIGEFVAAAAVIVSLIYLAVQIRQNTKSVRASTYHSVNRAAHEMQMIVAGSETLSRVMIKAAREPEALSLDERLRFNMTMRSSFAWYEDIYFQYQQSMVGRDYWEARQRSMLDQLREPGISSWWCRNSRLYTNAFVAEVSRLLQDTEASDHQRAEPERRQTQEA